MAAVQPKILFLGDSITAQWAGAGRSHWEQWFAPLNACQAGISGETTQGLLWCLKNGSLDAIDPGIVVVMIGTNNIGRHMAGEIVIGVETIWQEIGVRLPKAHILAMGLTPRDRNPETWFRGQTEEISHGLQAMKGYERLGPRVLEALQSIQP